MEISGARTKNARSPSPQSSLHGGTNDQLETAQRRSAHDQHRVLQEKSWKTHLETTESQPTELRLNVEILPGGSGLRQKSIESYYRRHGPYSVMGVRALSQVMSSIKSQTFPFSCSCQNYVVRNWNNTSKYNTFRLKCDCQYGEKKLNTASKVLAMK